MLSNKQQMRNSAQPAVRGDIAMARGPWMNQYNVIINMNSHYQRLNKVKSTIDTSPPKCLSTNTRKRDSVNRSMAMGLDTPKTYRQPNSSRTPSARPQTARPYSSRPSFSSSRSDHRPKSSRPPSRSQEWDYLDHDQATLEAPLHEQLGALQLLKTEDFVEPVTEESADPAQTEKDELADKLIMMYGGGDAGRPTQTASSKSNSTSKQMSQARETQPLRTQRSITSQRHQPQLRPRTRAARSGDVLESRSHVFTATEKEFSPRILNKPKATSKLSQSKHYFRPKPKPPIKPSMFAGSSLVSVGDQGGNVETRSSTPLEDWRLSRENDERFETNNSEGVPKLDISLDQDNLKWLKRQESIKSRQRKISGEVSLASLSEEQDEEVKRVSNDEETVKPETVQKEIEEGQAADADNENALLKDLTKDDLTTTDEARTEQPIEQQAPPDGRSENSTAVQDAKVDEEDEDRSVVEKELVYLKFIQDVTSDLLSTGRLSERILTEIFKRHVEEYGEEKIPAEKADELHRQLRRDLGFVGDGDEAGERGLTKKLVRDMDEIVAEEGEKREGESN